MKKIAIGTIIGGIIIGGAVLYRATRNPENNTILTIQGTNMDGTDQKIVFTGKGCEYQDSHGDLVSGLATSLQVESICAINEENAVTESQFSCALNLCREINTPGDLRSCSSPNVTYTSSTGTCNVSGCGGADGSYAMSSATYTQIQNSCGGSAQYFDSCMAHGCAGSGLSEILTDPILERENEETGNVNTQSDTSYSPSKVPPTKVQR